MKLSPISWRPSVSSSACVAAATAAALTLSSASALQTDGSGTPGLNYTKAPSISKNAGIYHVQTGTWTRRPSAAFTAGPDVIYSNTASSPYFSTAGAAGGFAPGSTNFDEGGIPTTANTTMFPNPVDRDVYRVNGFSINYCDFGVPGSGGWEISFYESYTPCTNNANPTATITATGLPAAGGCWVIQIDLSGGQEFMLAGDGGDGFQDDPNLDSFGWSHTYAGTDGTTGAGFFLAGDPAATDAGWTPGATPTAGTETYFGGPSPCTGRSTGLLAADFWWLEDPNVTTNSNCYFFGGYSNNNGCGAPFNPFAAWYFELYAESGMAPQIGTSYCMSTPNSTGVMTELTATGSAAAADDNVRLQASNLAPGSLSIFITSETQGFLANPGNSSGNLCVVGGVGRFLQNPGQLKVASGAGEVSLDTAIGEWTNTAIPQAAPPFFYSASAGMTSNFQLWHRDIGGSNFSNGLSITWE